MRAVLLLVLGGLLVCSCAPREASEGARVAVMPYPENRRLCSPSGEQAVEFSMRDGSSVIRKNGERCDPSAYHDLYYSEWRDSRREGT